MEKMPVLRVRHFKRKYWDDLYQKRLQRFDELKSFDVETKNDLYDVVAPLLKKCVEAERKSLFTIEYSLNFFLIMSIFIMLISVAPIYSLIVDYIFVKESNLYSINSTITYIAFFIFFIILLAPFLLMIKSKGVLVYVITILSFLILEIFIFMQNWDKNSHYIINGITAAILVAILLFSFMFVFDRIFDIYWKFIMLRIYSRYPLPILVERLIIIIYQAETAGNNWIQLEYKQTQLTNLELAAKSIEY